MAINRGCAVAVGPAGDGAWQVSSEHAGLEPWGFGVDLIADAVQGIGHGLSAGDWRRYTLGVIACVLRDIPDGRATPPLRLSIASDVPLGAGLSSSAALEVALARALYAA